MRSALSSAAVARVIVVCHGIDPREIAAAADVEDDRVEFVRFDDGVRSPAGPFNHGLDLATGRFASIMGSDDELTSGAIDAWRRTADRSGADVVIPPLRHAGGARVPTPPTLRRRRLHGVRDRLAYRTAPLGIYKLERFAELRLTPGLPTGEDLAFTTRMWFSGAAIVRHTGAEEYLIHDGDERVSFTARPIGVELRAVQLLLADEQTQALEPRQRAALAVKLWRISVFGAVHYWAGNWTPADRMAIAGIVEELRGFAPAAVEMLSRADTALVRALADATSDSDRVDELSRQRRRFLSPSALLPVQARRLLAREAPLRFSFSTWWALRW